jgi:hypothetical protein
MNKNSESEQNSIWTNFESENFFECEQNLNCEQNSNLIKLWICSDFKKQKRKRKKEYKKEHRSLTGSDGHTCDWSLVRVQAPVF